MTSESKTNYKTISVETDSRGVTNLVLARPEKHNAMNAGMIRELRNAAKQLAEDKNVRVVILSAQGKSFCAGGDLGWMRDQAAKDRAGKMAESSELAYMLRDLDDLPKPLIGKVHGPAYGGGIGLMSVCDIVIAVETARFALTETKLGLTPATIGPYVTRRLGEAAVRRVFMNAKMFDAQEAQGLNFVSTIASVENLDEAVEKEVQAFLNCASGAVADAKALGKYLSRNPGQDLLSYTAERLADRWETDEAQEGIRCFFAGEKPWWLQTKN